MRHVNLYVASYSDDDSGGLTAFRVANQGGTLRPIAELGGIPGIIALARHQSGVIYAASATGMIFAVIFESGSLRHLSVHESGGDRPCSVTVAPTGHHLVTANYRSGTIAVHSIMSDGHLGPLCDLIPHFGGGPVADRQDASHLHHVVFDQRTMNLLVADLGADTIYVYRLDPVRGRLTEVTRATSPPGAGPRHLGVAGPDRVLVVDELASTVSWFRYAPRIGGLHWQGQIPASSILDHPSGMVNFPSELAIDEKREFVYVGNRGHDSIAVFSIETHGLLRVADISAGGSWPQHLVLHANRLYCALQKNDSVVGMDISSTGGVPHNIRQVAEVRNPTWILPG